MNLSYLDIFHILKVSARFIKPPDIELSNLLAFISLYIHCC